MLLQWVCNVILEIWFVLVNLVHLVNTMIPAFDVNVSLSIVSLGLLVELFLKAAVIGYMSRLQIGYIPN